jgi:hypothetical protein
MQATISQENKPKRNKWNDIRSRTPREAQQPVQDLQPGEERGLSLMSLPADSLEDSAIVTTNHSM